MNSTIPDRGNQRFFVIIVNGGTLFQDYAVGPELGNASIDMPVQCGHDVSVPNKKSWCL
jgi:hypothetical protein